MSGPSSSSSPYLAGAMPLVRFVKFLGGASLGRVVFSVVLLYFAFADNPTSVFTLVLVADLVQLSLRRGRWLVRVPLYVLAGVLLALAAFAAIVRLQGVESSLLGAAAAAKQAARALRRSK